MSEDQMKRDDGPITFQQENVPRRSKKAAIVRHYKRFWWAHLIAFLIVTAVAVCLTIFVGVPHIAQQKINQSTLTVQGISVTKTQTNNYTMSINSTIHADSSVSATIAPFEGDMYLEDLQPHTPFARVAFPQTSSKAVQTVNVTQFTPVLNMDAFTTFNTWLLNNETLRVTVKGDTTVKVAGISKHFGVTFKKTLTLTGLNKFAGLKVTQSRISVSTLDKMDDNFAGYSTIPNPSIIAFEIGNASFQNAFLGQNIGTLFIDNFSIYPGNNNVSIRAKIQQGPVLSGITRPEFCKTGILPFSLIGINVTNHGENIPYFGNALAQLNSTVDVNVGADLKAIGLPIGCSG